MPAAMPAPSLREIGLVNHRGGDLQAAARYYRATIALEPDEAETWQRMGVLLRQRSEPFGALVAFDRSLAAETGNALRHGNRGIALRDLGRLPEAMAEHRRSLALEPGRSGGHLNLGIVAMGREAYDVAVEALMRSVASDPGNADALDALGSACRGDGRSSEAHRWFRRAIAWRPSFSAAHFNLGGTLQAQALWEPSIACYRRSLAVRPGFAEVEWEMSFPLLVLGRFREGFRAFDGRWRSAGFPAAHRKWTKPAWAGEPLEGRRLLVHAEQGFGDTIQFARYVPLIRGAGAVTVEVQKPLVRLARTLASGVEVIASGDDVPVHDLQVPLMDLPRVFETDQESIPAMVPYFEVGSSPPRALRPKIGIAWTPSRTNRTFPAKSIPLPRLLEAFEDAHCRLASLQVDADARAELGGRNVVDAGGTFSDFLDTAKYLLGLDLVVTVDTAVAHLAGALARPVWLLLPAMADWRWLLDRRDSPWYPTMRLFRQPAQGDWDAVVSEVARNLAEHIRTRTAPDDD